MGRIVRRAIAANGNAFQERLSEYSGDARLVPCDAVYWSAKYGALIMSMSGDWVDYFVHNGDLPEEPGADIDSDSVCDLF